MGNLILTEILFAITYLIASLVLWEFVKSKDGQLRKIMIAYFGVEVFVYLSSAIYFWVVWEKVDIFSINTFRIIVIIPKVAVKLWLLWWFKGRKSKSLH